MTIGVAVVTGGSAGIGRATARRFARAGFRVALIARDEGRLESARRELEQQWGTQAIAIAAFSVPRDPAR